MAASRDLTVAVHAQLLPGSAGGIETNLRALLRSLAGLDESGRQVVIGPGGESSWLRPLLGPRQSVLEWPPIAYSTARPVRLPKRAWSFGRRLLRGYARGAGPVVGGLSAQEPPQVAHGREISTALARMGVDLVHFPYQRHFSTPLPSLFEPWDLQHRHFPEFFTPEEIELREESYRTGCDQAKLVVTATQWNKDDLVRQFGQPPDKIAVIRRGPARGETTKTPVAEAAAGIAALGLPPRFILYPAKTWPHKNHARLFRALAALRDRCGLTVPLVCTGKPVASHWPVLRKSLEDLGLDGVVRFTGHLAEAHLAALYGSAAFLVFPSLFEGLGIPLLEAMDAGLPIVTSDATCLPEIAGDAAIFFDPLSVDSIAEAIHRAWTQPSLLAEYGARAAERAGRFRWEETARAFLACYRQVAGRPLSAEDRSILSAVTGV
jgi:glycosyltransferase involved in cell wall biosynthesis